jgi:hypothetical protein
VSLPRLRAPEENGAVLAQPPLAELGRHVESNRSLFYSSSVCLGGMPLSELRRLAIGEAVEQGRAYFREAGEPIPDVSVDSLLMAGHQPELFHPGVWLNNFALSALAGRHGAASLNLVVDNDTAKSAAVRFPVLGARDDPAAVHLVTVPYDQVAGEGAYEERAVRYESEFAAFPRAVAERTANWSFTPILPAYWDDVLRQRNRTRLLGERLVAGRRAWERRWGCHNLEVPMSRLCRTEAFARFAVALLDGLAGFHAAYNDCVRDYRRRHRIRSANHPVPDLQRDGDWLEAPFWAWLAGGQRRGRLFVRQVAGGWQLRSGDQPWPDLPWTGAVDHWRRLEADGFKVRTRALTTTLFARLCLTDLFVHGIGGGKYDELTDAIIRRHFELAPPAFMVLTGTLRLPLPGYAASAKEATAGWRTVRDIYWNPQRHLPQDGGDWHAEADAKRALTIPGNAIGAGERFREFRRLTERLRSGVGDVEVLARDEAVRTSAEAAANAILRRRDYAYCLFPEATLRPFLTQFTSACRSTC